MRDYHYVGAYNAGTIQLMPITKQNLRILQRFKLFSEVIIFILIFLKASLNKYPKQFIKQTYRLKLYEM